MTNDRVVCLRLNEDESDYLWEKRNYLYDYPAALPRMIQVCCCVVLYFTPFEMLNV